MLQGECINCGRNSWLIDYMCPKCIRKREEKDLLKQGKMSKGGVNEKPKGNRPPAPPKQTKKDLEKLYVDAIKLIDELEEENKKLKEENDLLSEHCAKLEEPIIDKIMVKLNSKSK